MSDINTMIELADHCVMCGLCLPHCPTYRLLRNEADSPRGRIALMQALACGQLEASPALLTHLDRCLACRACERMCPSKVQYGRLIDTSRAALHTNKPKPLQLLLDNVSNLDRLQRTAKTLRTYQRSGVQWLARKSGILKGLELEGIETLLPPIPEMRRLRGHYPATGNPRGEVGLFIGCIGSIMEGQIHLAAIQLLNRFGFSVHIPSTQECCGSLHQHNGEPGEAKRLARSNIAAFAGMQLDAVISTASGCAAQLSEYESLHGDSLPAPVYEICDFLQQHWPESGPQLSSQPMRAALHLPCTQRNVLRQPETVEKLLSRIPDLELVPLPGNDQCCGAAGSYMLTQSRIANALREPKINAIRDEAPNVVISNNIGCALHIVNGLKEQGLNIDVMHPVQMITRSL